MEPNKLAINGNCYINVVVVHSELSHLDIISLMCPVIGQASTKYIPRPLLEDYMCIYANVLPVCFKGIVFLRSFITGLSIYIFMQIRRTQFYFCPIIFFREDTQWDVTRVRSSF